MIEASNSGLSHLKNLSQLKTLVLNKTHITDSGLVSLQSMSRLESLQLQQTGVAGYGLTHLSGLRHFAHLSLGRTSFRNGTTSGPTVTLAALHNLPTLVTLGLSGTTIGDDELVHVSKCTELQHLDLMACQRITDASAATLSRLSNLRSLNLYSTQVSSARLAQLQRQLPLCQIRSY